MAALTASSALPTHSATSLSSVSAAAAAAKSGSMEVRVGLFKSWTRRWFVIEDHTLVQYNNSKLTKVHKKYELHDRDVATVSPKDSPRKRNCLRVAGAEPRNKRTPRKYYYFVAGSEVEQNAWVEALTAASGKKPQMRPEDMVFGIDLATLKANNNPASFDAQRQLPVLVIKCVDFLSEGKRSAEEGIFRLGGNYERIQELRQQFDFGRNPDFDKLEDAHVVAGLFKLFFRTLPQPLLLTENYDALLSVCRDNERALPDTLRETIAKLPAENQRLLQYLSVFLVQVSRFAEQSKMDIKNLATVFGPNLLRGKDDDPLKLMAESDLITHIALCMFQNANTIFASVGAGVSAGVSAATNGTSAAPAPAPAPAVEESHPPKQAEEPAAAAAATAEATAEAAPEAAAS